MQVAWWFRWAAGLLGVSLVLFALPSHLEGPVLVRISAGHAIAVLDAVAIVPLVIASALLFGGLWVERAVLRASARHHPVGALGTAFGGGLGLGLLLASVFTGVPGLWAIGAGLFTGTVVAAGLRAGRH